MAFESSSASPEDRVSRSASLAFLPSLGVLCAASDGLTFYSKLFEESVLLTLARSARSKQTFIQVLTSAAVIALAPLGFAPAQAAVVQEFNGVYNSLGGVVPASDTPWLTATFETLNFTDVKLTVEASLDVTTEYIDQVLFNIDPLKHGSLTGAPPDLQIVQVVSGVGSTPIASFDMGVNNQDTQGGGNLGKGFDIKFKWGNANADRFDNTDINVFILTLASGLLETDFSFTNASELLNSAHVLGITNPDGGDTISAGVTTVPIPAAAWLFGSAFMGLVGVARRRRNQATT